MRGLEVGDTIVLIADVESYETPFFAKTGSKYEVLDVIEDPYFPSGMAVQVANYGGTPINIDKSLVVHISDWKRIANAVINQFANFGGF